MVPEDALFWMCAIDEAPADDPNLLCVRHADAMVVPRGWTLDDRREDTLRLFKPVPIDPDATPSEIARPRARRAPDPDNTPVQLVIDGTGEIGRPVLDDLDLPDDDLTVAAVADGPDQRDESSDDADPDEPAAPWRPAFDQDDDLDGLLSVSSPLLARAFRGADRPA